MDYVKQLEAKLIDLEDRNLHLVSINTHVTDKNDNLLTERDLLRKGIETLTGKLQLTKEIVTEMAMTIKARDRALRLCRACQGDGRIKSDY
ncbi:MAG: hypothetical protein HRT86_14970 [Ilumatobacteraceae bacterium]|nr:hypothetical protein [Ilumatobacteraceae bacterium]